MIALFLSHSQISSLQPSSFRKLSSFRQRTEDRANMQSQLHRHIRNPILIVVIAANRTFLHQTNSSSSHTVLSWYLQSIDKSATQIHIITLKNDNCSVRWIQYHDCPFKMLDKLTVRNDVMDFLLTLFLLACSLNEVPGRNNAVQNVFTFS
ncbi:hypothetical protein BASA83_012617 [Batrachochytrium salamandrivorans]|nr:hypothetical protein BASA83_012617 [Batrachochytrium salamandrivorans]